MGYIAGERIEAGEAVYIDPSDGTVRPLRRKMPGYDVVLEGGPMNGEKLRFGFLPHVIQVDRSYQPTDEFNGYLDEYVETDARDDEGRTIYRYRRQLYTAEGGTWKAVP